MKFASYKEDGIIDRGGFLRVMKELILECNPNLSDNERIKMDSMLLSLYSLFDIDKNGILKVDEVSAALCVLCRGSMAKKINFGLKIFSSTDTDTEVKIRLAEL